MPMKSHWHAIVLESRMSFRNHCSTMGRALHRIAFASHSNAVEFQGAGAREDFAATCCFVMYSNDILHIGVLRIKNEFKWIDCHYLQQSINLSPLYGKIHILII
jgi:hypothetical protein